MLSRQSRRPVLQACALAGFLIIPCAIAYTQQANLDVLRIGTSGSLSTDNNPGKEKGAMASLQAFIKDETGLKNEIVREKDWRTLTDKLTKGELHLGVYQGFEYAWAQEGHPGLKPLALAVNVYRYPVAYVVTRRDAPVKTFQDLEGKTLALPPAAGRHVRLFVERECTVAGKPPEKFFSKVTTPDNVEDALDDAVDGTVQAVAADRTTLDAFKRRKPGRFNQLKEVAHSQPFPPPVVAHYGSYLDEGTLTRFRDGLINASKKDKGQMVLTLFHLTGFAAVPDDFGQVLAETRKLYPPPDAKSK